MSLCLSLNALPSLFAFASSLFWFWVQKSTACSALSSLVYWMDTATLQSLHCGLLLNESDMKRGCGALYCEDQLLVICKESYPSDHVGFHDSQHGCEMILYCRKIPWMYPTLVNMWPNIRCCKVLICTFTLLGFEASVGFAEHFWHIN